MHDKECKPESKQRLCVSQGGVEWGVSINLVVNVFLFFKFKNDFVCEEWMHLQLNGVAVGSKKIIYCCIGKLVRTDKGQLQKESGMNGVRADYVSYKV